MTPLSPGRHRPGRARRRRDRGRRCTASRRRRRCRCCWPPGAESIAAAFDGKLAETLALLGATGAAGRGDQAGHARHGHRAGGRRGRPRPEPAGAAPAPETLRRAAGAAVRALAGAGTVALALPLPDDDGRAAPALRAVAEGALLGAYRFAGYKTKPQPGRRDPVTPVARARAGRRATRPPRPRSKRARRGRRGGRPHPRLGQHRAQRAAPAGVRRRRWPRRPATPGSRSRCSTRRR